MIRLVGEATAADAWARLDLGAVAAVLAGGAPTEAGACLAADETRRFLEGYRYVDRLLGERIDLFAYGESGHLLELNHRVLVGITPERRQQFATHLAATERRFYDGGEAGGFGELHAWYLRNAGRPARALAAGAFVQVVSTPQLFVEGNQRTALLLACYLLARGGLPPVVPRDWAGFEALAGRVVAIDRRGIAAGVALMLAGHRVGEFLAAAGDPRLLAAA
ncbi:MAG: hypothetical protein U1E59_15665 [Amaricoccus sp.]